MIKELRIVISGRLCPCPEPKQLSTVLRGPHTDPILEAGCRTCGATVSRPIAQISIQYYEEH